MSDRPSWHAWALGLADSVSKRADCTRRQVGAVIMRPDRSIVATGYNGGPARGPSCLKGQCPRGLLSVDQLAPLTTSYDTGPGSCIALHAEQNAMLRASWDEMKGSTMAITCEPCAGCIRMITGTPLAEVIWPGAYARVTNGHFSPWTADGNHLYELTRS